MIWSLLLEFLVIIYQRESIPDIVVMQSFHYGAR
jgi:hypothetical protein